MPLPCVPWMPRLGALDDLSFGHLCPRRKRPRKPQREHFGVICIASVSYRVISFTMTREEQLKCIEDNCNAFKKGFAG